MTDLASHLAALRGVMAKFPAVDAHAPNTPIDVDDIYFPKSHAAALDPDRSLVIGNRGMGKSFWANALVREESRSRIISALPEARLGNNVDVRFGFAEGEGSIGISRDALAKAATRGSTVEQIWRAITLPDVAKSVGSTLPKSLDERLLFVASEPSKVREIMRAADAHLFERRGKLVLVFDQLEQLADDFDLRANLTQGILRLALAFKSYRSLRVKVFMRPDHFAEDRLFAFADASKIKGEALFLDWRGVDLYGLLYSRLLRSASNDFLAVCHEAEVSISSREDLASQLMNDEEQQHRVFDLIAGDAMGSRKRGLPYTWLLSHLADARNQVSPRTFLRALKFAAEHAPAPADKAVDHLGIYEGVRQASQNRVDDLNEDYPWVPQALRALAGALVPCFPDEMIAKWQAADGLMERLRENVPLAKRPPWLAEATESEQGFFQDLLKAMAAIGVVENRITTGKVDVPDIFRLPNGIKRRGGITQQQRRKARMSAR